MQILNLRAIGTWQTAQSFWPAELPCPWPWFYYFGAALEFDKLEFCLATAGCWDAEPPLALAQSLNLFSYDTASSSKVLGYGATSAFFCFLAKAIQDLMSLFGVWHISHLPCRISHQSVTVFKKVHASHSHSSFFVKPPGRGCPFCSTFCSSSTSGNFTSSFYSSRGASRGGSLPSSATTASAPSSKEEGGAGYCLGSAG